MSALREHLCWSRCVVWWVTALAMAVSISTFAQESPPDESMLTLGAVFPQENVSEFRLTMERAIEDYKNDYPNISVNPLTVTPGNNPQEMLNETCESLAGTNIAALLVVGEARTFQILSLYGAHLGIPVLPEDPSSIKPPGRPIEVCGAFSPSAAVIRLYFHLTPTVISLVDHLTIAGELLRDDAVLSSVIKKEVRSKIVAEWPTNEGKPCWDRNWPPKALRENRSVVLVLDESGGNARGNLLVPPTCCSLMR
ncbi:Glutamate receptor ionotropic, NMDA 3A [Branchiostoma belcheri]|nr:Glutamate receptor ionotropic, NMDA 3A [Branchiostoma belcheri]